MYQKSLISSFAEEQKNKNMNFVFLSVHKSTNSEVRVPGINKYQDCLFKYLTISFEIHICVFLEQEKEV